MKRPDSLPPALEAMLRNKRLVHALCLEGEEDGGLWEAAYALGGAILCEVQEGPMCGRCISCRKVLARAHSDLFFLDGSDGGYKKKNIRVLRAEAHRKPTEGRAKVYVFHRAQEMDREVQNLLLKLMEEPPADTYFILTCDNRHLLLETVLSRVMTFPLPEPAMDRCEELLRGEFPDTPPEEVARAALLCGGRPGVGRQILSGGEGGALHVAAFQVAEGLARREPYTVMTALAPYEKDRAAYGRILPAATELLMDPGLQSRWSLSRGGAVLLVRAVREAAASNDANGYLPACSALLSGAGAEVKSR